MENECMALREMVSSQQVTIQNLISELEEERNASSSAANETISMILRLQREKAEIQMEAKQFKRYAEEKMAHDQQDTLAPEDLLYKREQAIHSLTCEVQAYKHRMTSYSLTENEAAGENGMSRNNSLTENLEGQFEFHPYAIYPLLKCNSQDCVDGDDEATDIEKYAFGETPRTWDQFKDLKCQICQLEESRWTVNPHWEYSGSKSLLEKVVVGQSFRQPRHLKKFSTDSSNSLVVMCEEISSDLATESPKFDSSFKKSELSHLEEISNFRKVDSASEVGDDFSDGVYTIDSVNQGALPNGVMDVKDTVAFCDEEMTTQMELGNHLPVKDIEIQKLYARLHALEADRELMRRIIFSVGTEKAQLLLLKEIAQNWCQDMSPAKSMPTRKSSAVGSFPFMLVFKSVDYSFRFLEKKSTQMQIHVWIICQQCGLVNAIRQKTSRGTNEMYINFTHAKWMAHTLRESPLTILNTPILLFPFSLVIIDGFFLDIYSCSGIELDCILHCSFTSSIWCSKQFFQLVEDTTYPLEICCSSVFVLTQSSGSS